MLATTIILFLCIFTNGGVGISLTFPPGFRFGAASSAYQVEGAWNVSDKGVNNWDHFSHEAGRIRDGSTGDVACDSYHQWRRDIQMAKELGLHFYRFSISWSRLLPTGLPDIISEDGKKYYNDLINGLLEAGIEPLVTILHVDLPMRFEQLGGWTNPNMADWYTDYARVVFTLFADRVKLWNTINEPMIVCTLGFGMGILAPGVKDPELAMYHCYKNNLIAHARAWRIYDEEFRPKYHGKVALTNQLLWFEPASEGEEELTELVHQYVNDIVSHPIYSDEGGWPPEVEALVFKNSQRDGLTRSRLPPFTDEEIDLVRGTYDFYSLNTARTVRRARPDEKVPPFPLDGAPELGAVLGARESWEDGASIWFKVYPEGLRKQLRWIKENCNNPEIMITENGLSTAGLGVDDDERVRFYQKHLKQVLLAIQEDQVNVTAFTAWSLMDSYEWVDGYSVEFGLYSVDFNSPTRERKPKKSAKYYSKVIAAHSLNLVPGRYGSAANSANRLTPGFLPNRLDLLPLL